MKKIKKGDIVARKSHGKDILFFVNVFLEFLCYNSNVYKKSKYKRHKYSKKFSNIL